MKAISVADAAAAMGGRLIRTCEENSITGVKHDSRECSAGDMFVCIAGENRDGHEFIPQVVEQGCRTVLISNEEALPEDADVNAILVDDTVRAMGDLAEYYLRELDIIRVAVTGSVGKTSTRDMICSVLNEKYRCGKNLKNYNNDIGLPLSIFTLDESYDAVVLEMGMSGFGEIDRLSRIVRPMIGVITNIGVAHMENLGSRDGIFQAKMEITNHLLPKEEGGTMVFVQDPEFLTRERTAGDYSRIFVGTNGKSDFIVSDITEEGIDGIRFRLEHDNEVTDYAIPVPGRHNAFNGAAAAAVGTCLGMTLEEIGRGLARTQLTGSRMNVIRKNGLTVIDDTYNASPDSVKSALKVLEQSRTEGRRVAILGEMYELGEQSEALHYGVGTFARSCRIDRLITIGPLARHISEGASGGALKTSHFKTKEAFLKKRDEYVSQGDVVLVKASRGMKMEEIVEALTEGQEQK